MTMTWYNNYYGSTNFISTSSLKRNNLFFYGIEHQNPFETIQSPKETSEFDSK